MISFMRMPLYPWGKSPQYQLGRRLGDTRAGLDAVVKRNKLSNELYASVTDNLLNNECKFLMFFLNYVRKTS
jgi:hypothetical protein